MSAARRALLLLLGCGTATACSGGPYDTCGVITTCMPRFHVTDARTRAPICDATVTAPGLAPPGDTLALVDARNEDVKPDAGVDCWYEYYASGSATVYISKPGYATQRLPNVATSTRSCGGDERPCPGDTQISLQPQ